MEIIGGSGNRQEVDDEKRALVDARSDFQRAADRGDAFVWAMEDYTQAATDTILLVRNDNSAKKLHITEVRIAQGNTKIEIEIHRVIAAFTAAGTAVVGVNLNGTSGKTAEATAKADETGNTQGTVVQRIYVYEAKETVLDFKGAFSLGYNQAIGIDMKTGADWCLASITGYFK